MSVSGIAGKSGAQVAMLLKLQKQLADLNRQLGTGQKSETYSGLGLDRGLSMALRSQLSTVTTFQQTAKVVDTRIAITQDALQQIDKSAHTVKNLATMAGFSISQGGQTNDQIAAAGQLDQILNALNAQFGDQYIFSGKSSDIEPVETTDHILNGNGTLAGLKQLISERAQADLGATGMGRTTLSNITSTAATIVGAGATLTADAPAVAAGSVDISGAFTSAGGTLIINGTTVTINPGDDDTAILAAINAAPIVAATGVTASLNGANQLRLTSANADTAITIGAGSTLLAELGIAATTTNPNNLLTQGAVTAGQTLTITIGANATLTVTFGTNGAATPPEVSTLAELNACLATLAGGTATANATGNIAITAGTTGETITVGGSVPPATFGLGTTSASPSNVFSWGEDAAGHPFGFKITGASTDLAGTTLTPGGPPTQYTINVVTNPTAGQKISFVLTLPDGTTQTLTLTASTATPPGIDEFAIGATSDVTATNLRTLLNSTIGKLANTSLTAASAIQASKEFFNIDAVTPPQRVNGPPFNTATSLVAGTSTNTVMWYRGEAGTTRARDTAYTRVDTSISVSFGARANEQALCEAVSNIAVFAATSYSTSDVNAAGKYNELKQRVSFNLGPPSGAAKITDIEAELAAAQTTMASGKDRQQQTVSALNTMIDTISGVTPEQVGAEILALQTRLQASYQTTAMLAKTSLVYFLSA